MTCFKSCIYDDDDIDKITDFKDGRASLAPDSLPIG